VTTGSGDPAQQFASISPSNSADSAPQRSHHGNSTQFGRFDLLPPTITGPIFAKATEQSAVQSLARRVPLSVSANTAIPIPMDVPVADWVAEGGVKPAAQVGVGVKQMTGKKVALLVPVSEEVAMTNPAGLYDQLVQDLPTAIARAFDYAVINGKSLRTGGAGPFGEYLAQATNTVALGTTANSCRRPVRRRRDRRRQGHRQELRLHRHRRRPAVEDRRAAADRHRRAAPCTPTR
jgi:HK97 family phage major capsid protein